MELLIYSIVMIFIFSIVGGIVIAYQNNEPKEEEEDPHMFI